MIPSNPKKNKFSLLIVFMTSLFIFQTYAQTINGSFDSKFKRYQKNERFPVGVVPTQEWSTVAWKGERINKQIVLWSDTSISDITYAYSDLTSVDGNDSIPSSSIKLSFGKYVKGDTRTVGSPEPGDGNCSGYPNRGASDYIELIDALSTKDTITSLTSSDPIKLWITIDVPTGTVPGTYRGTFTATEGGGADIEFSIELIVVNHTLPDVSDWNFHLDLWQFPANILDRYNDSQYENRVLRGVLIEAWSDEHFDLLEPAYRLLADAGQKVITAHIKKGALGTTTVSPMVKWTKKTDDTWVYDFTVFEKYVDKMISWGITKQISCFSPLGWNKDVIPYWDEATNRMINLSAPLGSTTYTTRWNHFLTEFKIFLDGKGWFDKTVLYLDESKRTELEDVSLVVHGNNNGWKLGIAYSHSYNISETVKTKFYDLSGILGDASAGISDNKIKTFYTSCTQIKPNSYVTSDNSPAEMTWMAWHSLKEGYDGYLRWAYDYWRLGESFDARDGSNTAGDFSMIYYDRGVNKSKFLTSLRLMMLREGIQDFEKIKFLRAISEVHWTDDYRDGMVELEGLIDLFVTDYNSEVQDRYPYIESYVKGGQTKLATISKLTLPTLGIEDIKSENRDVVYPSLLTKDKSLILDLPEAKGLKTEFFLFNIIGQIVYKKEYNMFSGKETIDIQDLLTSGIYIVKVISQKKSYTQKIVIAD